MIVSCRTGACRCNAELFTVREFTGVVEIRHRSCRTTHTFTFGGSTSEPTAEIRCTNSFKGRPELGGWCGMLVARISHDSTGIFEYRCIRCKQSKVVRIGVPALVST